LGSEHGFGLREEGDVDGELKTEEQRNRDPFANAFQVDDRHDVGDDLPRHDP